MLNTLDLAPTEGETEKILPDEPRDAEGEGESDEDPSPMVSDQDLISRIDEAYLKDPVLQELIKATRERQRRILHQLLKEGLRLEMADLQVTAEGRLYVRNRLYIPDADGVRAAVIEQAHDTLCGGHSGKYGTYEKTNRWYYWPRMTTDVARYVRACLMCKRTKAYRDGKHGLLHPLPIPDRYWQSISMDFITELPKCKYRGRTFTNIMVTVDRLTKNKKFIPLENLRVETMVQAFVEYIWREEGYPEEIVSDRGAQFVSHFWKRLCQRLGTKPKLSTAYHPETDGQTENANAYLKQYLRAFVSYRQDDWVQYLPTAEFEANDTVSASTGVSPFVVTKGYPPRSGIEPPQPTQGTAPVRRQLMDADKFVARMQEVRTFLRSNIAWAQAKQAEYANTGRLPAPAFREGDRVMLDCRYIRTTRPSHSLDYNNRGPFPIVEVIDNMAYRVQLPDDMRGIHDVFHPWLLHLYDEQPLPGQDQEPEGPVEVEEDEMDYVVEEVLDSRMDMTQRDPRRRGRPRGVLQYLVKWANYPEGPDNPSWEPYMNLEGSPDLIQRFYNSFPEKAAAARRAKYDNCGLLKRCSLNDEQE